MNYSQYNVSISNDPSYYGSTCTQDDADRISPDLAKMIEGEFPGINVSVSGSKTTGPDSDVIEEINAWISENWSAAL
jgi:hypothetical protein